MAGTFDPVAARRAVERFAEHIKTVNPEFLEGMRDAWADCYMDCGHKALGRLMIGRTVDDACKAFDRS